MQEPIDADRLRRRRSVVLLIVFGLAALGIGVCTSVRTRGRQPEAYWPAYAQAPRAGADALPPFVPPSATEIHVRRDASEHMRWVRFTYAPADHDRVTAGLRRLSFAESLGVDVQGPSFTPWWTVNERTMLGRAGKRLEVWQVPGKKAWLFVDPLANAGFYWSTED
jgi:hypothetical protein